MFKQVQGSFLAIASVVNSPKWVSREGVDLAEGVPVSGNRGSDPTIKRSRFE